MKNLPIYLEYKKKFVKFVVSIDYCFIKLKNKYHGKEIICHYGIF